MVLKDVQALPQVLTDRQAAITQEGVDARKRDEKQEDLFQKIAGGLTKRVLDENEKEQAAIRERQTQFLKEDAAARKLTNAEQRKLLSKHMKLQGEYAEVNQAEDEKLLKMYIKHRESWSYKKARADARSRFDRLSAKLQDSLKINPRDAQANDTLDNLRANYKRELDQIEADEEDNVRQTISTESKGAGLKESTRQRYANTLKQWKANRRKALMVALALNRQEFSILGRGINNLTLPQLLDQELALKEGLEATRLESSANLPDPDLEGRGLDASETSSEDGGPTRAVSKETKTGRGFVEKSIEKHGLLKARKTAANKLNVPVNDVNSTKDKLFDTAINDLTRDDSRGNVSRINVKVQGGLNLSRRVLSGAKREATREIANDATSSIKVYEAAMKQAWNPLEDVIKDQDRSIQIAVKKAYLITQSKGEDILKNLKISTGIKESIENEISNLVSAKSFSHESFKDNKVYQAMLKNMPNASVPAVLASISLQSKALTNLPMAMERAAKIPTAIKFTITDAVKEGAFLEVDLLNKDSSQTLTSHALKQVLGEDSRNTDVRAAFQTVLFGYGTNPDLNERQYDTELKIILGSAEVKAAYKDAIRSFYDASLAGEEKEKQQEIGESYFKELKGIIRTKMSNSKIIKRLAGYAEGR